MIVAEQKSLDELKKLVVSAQKVLVVGCGTCVTVCFAGGAREAAIVAAELRMSTRLDGSAKEVTDVTVQRQCEWEYLDEIAPKLGPVDIILSLGCGVGVQAIAEHFPGTWVVPGLNTKFMGLPTEQGVWAERCAACGDCILGITGGICPIARWRGRAGAAHLPVGPGQHPAGHRVLRPAYHHRQVGRADVGLRPLVPTGGDRCAPGPGR